MVTNWGTEEVRFLDSMNQCDKVNIKERGNWWLYFYTSIKTGQFF